MAIKMTLDKHDFANQFIAYGREDQFSHEALDLLFYYFDDIGEDVELDVVSICCEYEETSIEDCIQQYDIDIESAEDDADEIKEIVREYLEDNTFVVGETSDGFVFVSF